jgi:hypothetical protein
VAIIATEADVQHQPFLPDRHRLGSPIESRTFELTGVPVSPFVRVTAAELEGARYYAPWLARWTAADPIGLQGGVNRYSYVVNNPLQYVDPKGTDPLPYGNWQSNHFPEAYYHMLRKGGLGDIATNQRLIATEARPVAGGSAGVRAFKGPYPRREGPPSSTTVEFYNYKPWHKKNVFRRRRPTMVHRSRGISKNQHSENSS